MGEPARERLVTYLHEVEGEMHSPKCDVYMNVSGRRITPHEARGNHPHDGRPGRELRVLAAVRAGDDQGRHHRVLRVRTDEAAEGHDEAHRPGSLQADDQF